MPRRTVIVMMAGVVVAAVVGIVLLVHGQPAPGVFLLVAPALTTSANLAMIRRSLAENQPGAPPRRGAATGRRLTPHPTPPHWPADHEQAWTGGANVVARMGRLNATWPLAVMTLREETLSLRFRPRLISAMSGVASCSWNAADLSVIYPVRGRLVGFNRGVAIESTTRPLAYFWTLRPEPILAALAAHDMPVDWTERTIRLWR